MKSHRDNPHLQKICVLKIAPIFQTQEASQGGTGDQLGRPMPHRSPLHIQASLGKERRCTHPQPPAMLPHPPGAQAQIRYFLLFRGRLWLLRNSLAKPERTPRLAGGVGVRRSQLAGGSLEACLLAAGSAAPASRHAHISEGRSLGNPERALHALRPRWDQPRHVSQHHARGALHPEGSDARLMGWGPEGPRFSRTLERCVLQDTEGRPDSFSTTGMCLEWGSRGSHRLIGQTVLSWISIHDPRR